MNNFTLFIFASPRRLIIGIFIDDRLFCFRSEILKQNLVERFFPILNQLLNKSNLKLSKIQNIFAGYSPGTYTTERVVATFLKTLKVLCNKIKIFTINNLFFLSGNQPKTISVIEANKKDFYIAGFDYEKCKISSQKIAKKELLSLGKKYANFKFIDETTPFDLALIFSKLKPFFQLKKDYHKILPKDTL